MKRAIFIILFMMISTFGLAYHNDGKAYIIYSDANRFYRDKDIKQAKSKYLEVVKKQSGSKYVPYSLYMLSFIETDYLKVIDYLRLMKDEYHSFKYWHQGVEKLGDIYYIIGDYKSASEVYGDAKTDKSYYMLGVIYSANGHHKEAIQFMNILLSQTRNKKLAYKAYIIQAKSLVALRHYDKTIDLVKNAVRLKQWSFDNGAGLLFYAAKSYFYKKDYEKSLYIFSLLRTSFPLSTKSTLAKNYLVHLEKQSIVVSEPVNWVEFYFARPAEIAYKGENADVMYDYDVEKKAENTVDKSEKIAAQIVASEVQEYVIRIAELKDLGVANLIATELSSPENRYPIGIYYRNKYYYAEIRGVKKLDTAKKYARSLIAMGYEDTKIIEVVKVTEYGR